MKKIKIVALVLAIVMLFAGCSLISPDEERIAMQVIATVNGTQIYNYQVSAEDVDMYVQQTLYYSGMTENDLSPEGLEKLYEDSKNNLLEILVNDEVMLQKAVELGITLTEEEIAQKKVDAQNYMENLKNSFVMQIEDEIAQAAKDAGEEVVEPDEDAATSPEVLVEAAIRAQEVLDKNRTTLESYHQYLIEQGIILKVREYTAGLAEVTDEQVTTWYNETLAIQKEEMDAAGGVFEEKIYQNKIYTYVPERIVAVRDLVIAFEEEPSALAKEMYDKDNMDEYNSFILEIVAKDSEIMTTANDIKARLAAGELMDDILAELTETNENISEANSKNGYLVGARTTEYSKAFVDAASLLKNIGDVSLPVADYKGVHILQVLKVYEPGVVAFADLKDSIKTALLPAAEQKMYEEMLAKWVEESKIKYYYNRMG